MVDPDDKVPFSVAIGALCETFGQQATKPILHGYWLGLQDLELTDVQRAVAVSIRSATSLPRPVELRRFAGEQTGEQRAIAAWGDVLRGLTIGPYKHIDFQDKLVNAAIRNLGGWPTFCGRFVDEESEKWARLDFIRAYQAFAAGGVDGEVCLPLAGLSQAEIVNGEQSKPVPRLIECSPDRAKEPRRIASVQPVSQPERPMLELKRV